MTAAAIRFWTLCCLIAITTVAQAEPGNPAPGKAFSAFGSYELRPIALDAADAAQKGKDSAAEKIQEQFNELVTPIVDGWNKKPAEEGAPRLVIEPRIASVKKVGGATRFWVGAMAGSSHVEMRVRFVSQPGGDVIAEPEFYQQAAAMSGAWTVGAQDNDMLRRIAVLVAAYLRANYDQAVGGPTGHEK